MAAAAVVAAAVIENGVQNNRRGKNLSCCGKNTSMVSQAEM